MSTHKWHYTNESERRQWQNPEAILVDVGLRLGTIFVDVGCGDGFFALPAARIVGPQGKVYGVDANDEAIAEIRRKAAAEGLTNIELTLGTAEETLRCQACADIVFFGNALHDFQDQSKVLQNARRMLKAAGKLINLDWKKEDVPLGPPLAIRFNEAKASQLIEMAGFKINKVEKSGQYHYLITASIE